MIGQRSAIVHLCVFCIESQSFSPDAHQRIGDRFRCSLRCASKVRSWPSFQCTMTGDRRCGSQGPRLNAGGLGGLEAFGGPSQRGEVTASGPGFRLTNSLATRHSVRLALTLCGTDDSGPRHLCVAPVARSLGCLGRGRAWDLVVKTPQVPWCTGHNSALAACHQRLSHQQPGAGWLAAAAPAAPRKERHAGRPRHGRAPAPPPPSPPLRTATRWPAAAPPAPPRQERRPGRPRRGRASAAAAAFPFVANRGAPARHGAARSPTPGAPHSAAAAPPAPPHQEYFGGWARRRPSPHAKSARPARRGYTRPPFPRVPRWPAAAPLRAGARRRATIRLLGSGGAKVGRGAVRLPTPRPRRRRAAALPLVGSRRRLTIRREQRRAGRAQRRAGRAQRRALPHV